MAITIEQSPVFFAPAYNYIVITASSTNVAQPKFNFIFEIYDGANTTLLTTLRIPPEINYSYGVCHINRVLEGYLGTDFFKDSADTQPKDCPNSYYEYTVRVGEEYEVAGVITQYLNLASVGSTCCNWSLKYNRITGGVTPIDDYDLVGTSSKFFTSIDTRTVDRTDEGFMHFYGASQPSNFKIQTYFSDGSIDQTATITNPALADVAMFPCNPVSLNAATLATGTQPLIDTDIFSYVIFSEDGFVSSQNYTFNVVDYCTPATLHFLNDLGGFDSFPFQVAKDSYTFEKEYYKQDPLRIQSDGSYVFSNLDREVVQNYTNQKQKTRLISNWISSEESEWLRELFSSPEIYLQKDGEFTSVLLKVTDYQQKYEEFDEIFNIEVEIEYSIDSYRQRY